MNAIVKVKEPLTPALSDAAQVMGMIARLSQASPEKLNLESMDKLFAMRDKELTRIANQEFAEAFASMLPELPIIDEKGGIRDRAGNVQSTYAKWADVNEAIKPVLSRHGFSLSFRSPQQSASSVTVTGLLRHRGGATDETTLTLPMEVSGSKNPVQAVGSTLSYAKRYTAGMLLNLTSRHSTEDDTDGVVETGPISNDQLIQLLDLMKTTATTSKFFCNFYAIDNEDQLPAGKFADAMGKLNAKARK